MLRAMLVLPLLAAAPWGQSQKPPTEGGFVFRTETRVVVCHTTVSDKTGRLITDVPKEAFTVFENGVRQEITLFKREDVPVSMGLIIDNSGSMATKRAKVEAADLDLVSDSNPDDEVFVVNFSDKAFLDLPHDKNFTSDIGEMKEALKRTDSRGETAMRDAVQMSVEHVRARGHKEKKVLVLVTDGEDNASTVKMEDLVKNAQQSDVLIYCVGLLGDEEPLNAMRAKRALQELSAATGGESFFPDDVSQVDRIAHQVARDIRNQYTIEYTPSNTAMDGSYRRIEIQVNAPGKPVVRTRSGYYAEPGQTGAGK
jgi:Ca-activated chloride channel family protein